MPLRLFQSQLRPPGSIHLFSCILAERGFNVQWELPLNATENPNIRAGQVTRRAQRCWWQGALPLCLPVESGRHFVVVRAGGVYLPPLGDLAQFENWLEGLGACIKRLRPLPTLVAGDFNAWSCTWGL